MRRKGVGGRVISGVIATPWKHSVRLLDSRHPASRLSRFDLVPLPPHMTKNSPQPRRG